MSVQDLTPRTRGCVAVERTIAAPAREVWSAIARPGALEICHPFCERNPVRAWPGPAARDEVHYLNGLIYERRFLEWIDGAGYDLEIGRRGGSQSRVSWRVKPIDDDSCTLQITVCPRVFQRIPSGIRWIAYAFWLRPRLREYLDSVVRGFKWFVIRREAVPKNAFGTHPWFS